MGRYTTYWGGSKKKLTSSYSPHEIAARTKGVPYLGAGVIYPIPEDEIVVKPFQIPDYWPRAYGFDPGWNQTAAVWGAIDPATDVLYLYSEYYRGKAEHSIHADAIKARGDWMIGAMDYAGIKDDGKKILVHYAELGLNVVPAEKSVDAGIERVWQRLSSGRMKIFSHLENWLREYRIYRRDDKGKVVKKNDHLMDATRYLIMTGLHYVDTPPDEDSEDIVTTAVSGSYDKNPVTGY